MARKKSIEIELDLQDRDAKKKLRDLARDTGDVENAFEDAESAGQAMARAIERSADDMISEIDATKRAVDAMEQALADTDMDPQKVVSDLKRVGLSAEDVEQDAEELAAALQRAGDVKTHAAAQGFDNVGDAVTSVENDTGRAHDAMSGFVGGSVGELPLIGEAMGPVGESMGQLVEGAINGEVAMADLAKIAGPMAAVGGGVMLLNKALDSVAETEAFNREQVESMRDALLAMEDMTQAAEAYKSTLEETDQITARTGGAFGFFEDEENIMDDLVDAGVNVDLWTEAVTGNADAQDEVRGRLEALRDSLEEQAEAAGGSTREWTKLMQQADNVDDALEGLDETLANNVEAADEAADHAAFYGDALDDTEEAVEDNSDAIDRHIDSLQREIDALTEAADAQRDMTDAQLGAADTVYSLTEAQWAMTDAVQESMDVHADAEATQRDYEEANIAVAEAAQAVADAQVEQARQTARVEGVTMDAAGEVEVMNRSLLEQASVLSGPQRAALIRHIGLINGIPDDVMTRIDAQLERGNIDAAEALLNSTSRTRESAINATANTYWAEQALNYAARNRTASILMKRSGAAPGSAAFEEGRGATGGIVNRPTRALIGEAGPEAVIPLNRTPGNGPLPNMMGAGGTVNVTNNFPAGVRPADVINATKRWERIQGTTE